MPVDKDGEEVKFAAGDSFDFKVHYIQKRRKKRNSGAETVFQTSGGEDFILADFRTFTVQG
jgi:hypothetical protein